MSNEAFLSYLKNLLKTKLQDYLGLDGNYDLLAEKLASAMQENLRMQGDNIVLLPDTFTLVLPANKINPLQPGHRFVQAVKSVLIEAAQHLGHIFAAPLTVSLSINSSLSAHEIDLIASYRMTGAGQSQADIAAARSPGQASPSTISAFLILNGNQVFKLRQEIVNIGRRLDNHIVLNDPRVSRTHAQLRLIKGRYAIFDLNSTGGTYINGQRITQSILYPGDVISLAGATMVYGQDSPPPSADLLGTQPLHTPSSATDLPTAVLQSDVKKKASQKEEKKASKK